MAKELDTVTEKVLRDQERLQKIFAEATRVRNTFSYQLSPTIEAINRLNKKMEPYANLAKIIEANLVPFRSKVLEMQSNLSLIATAVNTKVLQNSEFVRIANQASSIAKIIADLQPETLSEVYSQAVQLYSNTETSDPIQATIARIEERTKSPGTVLSFEFYLSLVISLILFLMSQSASEESDERLFERLDRLESILLENYSTASEKEAGVSFYVVKRSVNFREGPSKRHEVIDVLFPNQKVKLVTRYSKWIEVEYYDHINDTYKRGWVYKKYLKLLNPKTPSKYGNP